MTKYKNLHKDSGVEAYEIGVNYIKVLFSKTRKIYTYKISKIGIEKFEELKRRAEQGCGLNEYIKRYCDKDYSDID